jgi:hypothetical protein
MKLPRPVETLYDSFFLVSRLPECYMNREGYRKIVTEIIRHAYPHSPLVSDVVEGRASFFSAIRPLVKWNEELSFWRGSVPDQHLIQIGEKFSGILSLEFREERGLFQEHPSFTPVALVLGIAGLVIGLYLVAGYFSVTGTQAEEWGIWSMWAVVALSATGVRGYTLWLRRSHARRVDEMARFLDHMFLIRSKIETE